MNIKTHSRLISSLVLLTSTTFASAATTNTLTLKSFAQGAEGVFISFTSLPSGCTTSYKGYHAIVPNTNSNLTSILVTLSQHRTAHTPLLVTYDSQGACDMPERLLLVRDVK